MKSLNASISPFKTLRFSFLCWGIFLISACSQQTIQPQWTKPDWQISGKIGFKQSLLNSGSLSFQWSQKQEDFIIHLFNPLGQLELTLKGHEKSVLAEKANGEIIRADSAEQLMQTLSGWSFPIVQVKQWLKGQQTGVETELVLEQGLLRSFQTPTWQVRLDKYQRNGEQTLPYRLKLAKNNLTLTIIIKQHDPRFY